MKADKLDAIAAESDEIRSERTALNLKLADLKRGNHILQSQTRMGKSIFIRKKFLPQPGLAYN